MNEPVRNELRAKRDSLPRSERGVWGVRRSTPQLNDDEPGLHQDYKKWLEWLAPYDPSPERYHHNKTGEDNGDAHHKRQVMGREVVVAITKGKLDCGPWEQIFYGEFDGRRAKRVLVKVIGE
jgi:secondary thiamine-phosphate synthase enzyme